MKRILAYILILLPFAAWAQRFNEYDRKVFNEGQVLNSSDMEFASSDIPWDPVSPLKLYSIHDEGEETIVVFSHSIYFDSQWVTFSKGIYVEDNKSGDIYKVRGYYGDLTMDRLLIVKGCKGKNVLVALRFPKFKRNVRNITIHSPKHEDDIEPSNMSRKSIDVIASNVRVKDYRNRHTMRKVYE